MLAKKGTSFLANAFRESYALFGLFYQWLVLPGNVVGEHMSPCHAVSHPSYRMTFQDNVHISFFGLGHAVLLLPWYS